MPTQTHTVAAVVVILIIIMGIYLFGMVSRVQKSEDDTEICESEKDTCESEKAICGKANYLMKRKIHNLDNELDLHILRWLLFPTYIETSDILASIMDQLKNIAPSTHILLVDKTPYDPLGGEAAPIPVAGSEDDPNTWKPDRYIIEFEYGIIPDAINGEYAVASSATDAYIESTNLTGKFVIKPLRTFYF